MARASGVLLHISSLWGDYGSGCFGDEAFEWIDFLKKSGFTYWQVLPLGIPDGYYSPYSALTAFGGNPWFVDLRQLYHQGLITGAELEQQRQQQPYLCEFERLAQSRMALLRRAALRVKNRAPIRAFILAHPQLASLCRFMALRQAYPGLPWQQWPKAAPDAQEEFVWQFIQHAFFTSAARVHVYAPAAACASSATCRSMWGRTAPMSGRIRSSSSWTGPGIPPASPASRRIILPPTASCGAIRCIGGIRWKRTATTGGASG
jgi:4-alpha-glucanotransferase